MLGVILVQKINSIFYPEYCFEQQFNYAPVALVYLIVQTCLLNRLVWFWWCGQTKLQVTPLFVRCLIENVYTQQELKFKCLINYISYNHRLCGSVEGQLRSNLTMSIRWEDWSLQWLRTQRMKTHSFSDSSKYMIQFKVHETLGTSSKLGRGSQCLSSLNFYL